MEPYDKSRLVDVLMRIDEEAWLELGDRPRMTVVIVGGSALLLSDLASRPATYDVDVLMADRALRGVLARHRVVNGAVAAYADQIPYGFESRLRPLGLPTRAVEYAVPCPEDIAVMKLYALRPPDVADLEGEALLGGLDWGLMDELVYGPDEARASALSERRWREMADAYADWARRHGHEPKAGA